MGIFLTCASRKQAIRQRILVTFFALPATNQPQYPSVVLLVSFASNRAHHHPFPVCIRKRLHAAVHAILLSTGHTFYASKGRTNRREKGRRAARRASEHRLDRFYSTVWPGDFASSSNRLAPLFLIRGDPIQTSDLLCVLHY